MYCTKYSIVLVPYKITLLSNVYSITSVVPLVLVPYKITLLSNCPDFGIFFWFVLVPYKITLLSNLILRLKDWDEF